jgi:uncharacterized protein YycO
MKLQFVATNTLPSEIITFYEDPNRKTFSHVDFLMADGNLLGARASKIGKIPAGVQIRPPNYELFIKRFIVDIPATEQVNDQFLSFMVSKIGSPYDHKAIFGFALPGYWHEKGAFICSALISAALKDCKIFCSPLFKDDWEIDPDQLLLILSAMFPIGTIT